MGLKIHFKLLQHINLYKIIHKHSFKRNFTDKILPAADHFTWDTANAVKLRMEKTVPGNYPPIRLGASPDYIIVIVSIGKFMGGLSYDTIS